MHMLTAQARQFKARPLPLHRYGYCRQSGDPAAVDPALLPGGSEQDAMGRDEGGGFDFADDGFEESRAWGSTAGAGALVDWSTKQRQWGEQRAASCASFSSACSLDGSGSFGDGRRAKAMAAMATMVGGDAEAHARSDYMPSYASTLPSSASHAYSATAALAHAQGTLLMRQQAWLRVREQRLEEARAVRAQQELQVRHVCLSVHAFAAAFDFHCNLLASAHTTAHTTRQDLRAAPDLAPTRASWEWAKARHAAARRRDLQRQRDRLILERMKEEAARRRYNRLYGDAVGDAEQAAPGSMRPTSPARSRALGIRVGVGLGSPARGRTQWSAGLQAGHGAAQGMDGMGDPGSAEGQEEEEELVAALNHHEREQREGWAAEEEEEEQQRQQVHVIPRPHPRISTPAKPALLPAPAGLSSRSSPSPLRQTRSSRQHPPLHQPHHPSWSVSRSPLRSGQPARAPRSPPSTLALHSPYGQPLRRPGQTMDPRRRIQHRQHDEQQQRPHASSAAPLWRQQQRRGAASPSSPLLLDGRLHGLERRRVTRDGGRRTAGAGNGPASLRGWIAAGSDEREGELALALALNVDT